MEPISSSSLDNFVENPNQPSRPSTPPPVSNPLPTVSSVETATAFHDVYVSAPVVDGVTGSSAPISTNDSNAIYSSALSSSFLMSSPAASNSTAVNASEKRMSAAMEQQVEDFSSLANDKAYASPIEHDPAASPTLQSEPTLTPFTAHHKGAITPPVARSSATPAVPTGFSMVSPPSHQSFPRGARLPDSAGFFRFTPTPSPSKSLGDKAFNPDDFLVSPGPNRAENDDSTGADHTPRLNRQLFTTEELLDDDTNDDLQGVPMISVEVTGVGEDGASELLSEALPNFQDLPQPNFDTPDDITAVVNDEITANVQDEVTVDLRDSEQPVLQTSPMGTSNLNLDIVTNQVLVNETLPPRSAPSFHTKADCGTANSKCTCKASQCLKLYCPCFAASGLCGPHCTCRNCKNTLGTSRFVQEARSIVLSRDPRAFESKVRQSAGQGSRISGIEIHSKGCNCRKGCSKNYCVCREIKVDCGPRCTCSGPNGCQNGKADAIASQPSRLSAQYLVADRSGSEHRPKNSFTSRVGTGSGSRAKKRAKKVLGKNEPFVQTVEPNLLSPSFPDLKISDSAAAPEDVKKFFDPSPTCENDSPFSMGDTPSTQANRADNNVPMVSQNGDLVNADGEVIRKLELPSAANQINQSRKPAKTKTRIGFLSSNFAFSAENHSGIPPPVLEPLVVNQRVVEAMERLLNRSTSKSAVQAKRKQLKNKCTDVKNDSVPGTPKRPRDEDAKDDEDITVRVVHRKKSGDRDVGSSRAEGSRNASDSSNSKLRGSLLPDGTGSTNVPHIWRVKIGSGELLRKLS